MELGFEWEMVAAPSEKGKVVKGTIDLRIHPGYHDLYTKCSAVTNPGKHKQSDCKYAEKGTNHNRCMYQKWYDFDLCDKSTQPDGTEVN